MSEFQPHQQRIVEERVNSRDCKHGHLARSCEICDLEKQSERYEKVRKLNPRQFAEIWNRNLKGENFDDMIDAIGS